MAKREETDEETDMPVPEFPSSRGLVSINSWFYVNGPFSDATITTYLLSKISEATLASIPALRQKHAGNAPNARKIMERDIRELESEAALIKAAANKSRPSSMYNNGSINAMRNGFPPAAALSISSRLYLTLEPPEKPFYDEKTFTNSFSYHVLPQVMKAWILSGEGIDPHVSVSFALKTGGHEAERLQDSRLPLALLVVPLGSRSVYAALPEFAWDRPENPYGIGLKEPQLAFSKFAVFGEGHFGELEALVSSPDRGEAAALPLALPAKPEFFLPLEFALVEPAHLNAVGAQNFVYESSNMMAALLLKAINKERLDAFQKEIVGAALPRTYPG